MTEQKNLNSRIPMLSEEEALQKGRELGLDDYIAKMNIFRVLLQHPKLAQELNSTIISLASRDKTLDDRLREIIIMRVSWLAACDYEWSQHWMASLFFGLTEDELFSIRNWQQADCFSGAERAVLLATDQLLSQGQIDNSCWEELAKHFNSMQLQIEVVTVIGNWHMFALILNGLQVPLEQALGSWPPDGIGPD